jgi:hypothetical protein
MALAPTLDGRMICACNCAYQIDGGGTLPCDPADTDYFDAGFPEAPSLLGPPGFLTVAKER